jgi:hypothetical protein
LPERLGRGVRGRVPSPLRPRQHAASPHGGILRNCEHVNECAWDVWFYRCRLDRNAICVRVRVFVATLVNESREETRQAGSCMQESMLLTCIHTYIHIYIHMPSIPWCIQYTDEVNVRPQDIMRPENAYNMYTHRSYKRKYIRTSRYITYISV